MLAHQFMDVTFSELVGILVGMGILLFLGWMVWWGMRD